jgi:ethanolamine utilization protein EutQ
MPRRVYTAADIHRLVDGGLHTLDQEPGSLLTPLARDEARRLSVAILEPPPPGPGGSNGQAPAQRVVDPGSAGLEEVVRRAVAAVMASGTQAAPQPPAARPAARPVVRVDGRTVELTPFPADVSRPEMDIRLRDVVTAADGSPMGGGFMSMRAGSFPWKLDYDEIDLVLEGELHIVTSEGTRVGLPGDVLFIPRGTSIAFSTPSWAKFFYVTYPADWAGG